MFVKICGITSEEDALLAVAMGADAVGFIFAPSKRQVSPLLVRDIARRLPPEILTVGVFRDDLAERVVDVAHTAGLRAVQLSGHELPAATRWIKARVPYVIQGFAAGDPRLEHADDFGADVIMIDSPQPGSGEVFDWSLAEGAPAGRKVLMAGGLTPENVADAIEAVRPWGVDVATGVEADHGEAGRKDATKVRRFIANAKAAGPPDFESQYEAPYDWMHDGE